VQDKTIKRKEREMKNIYFIEAKSPNKHIYSRVKLPRLGSIILATILKNKGYNTKVFIEDIAEPDWKELEGADLICLSSITSTAPRAYQLAKKFREKKIPVVMGGPHSTFLPDESLSYVDYVVRGEGEETIVELIEHLKSGLPLNTIKGLSFKTKDGIIHNPGRELISDLDAAPIPDFKLVYKWDKSKVAPIATSRGCPFACRFCSVIPMFGRKYRFKSIDRVIEEIKAVASEARHIFFIDDNFAADKKRTKELLRAILDNNLKIEWSAQMRTDIARDPELIKLMAKTGCFQVFIGFESINPKTLLLYNKGQKVEDIDNCIRLLKNHSIHIHGMFVLGSDKDDLKTIRDTQKYAKKLDIESIQFMMLTPLPGTPVFEEFRNQGRLLHTDWSKYDAHHAVFEPKLMTVFELHLETLRAMAKFYSWYSIIRHLLKMDFFFSYIHLYSKRLAREALKKAKKYLRQLREQILAKLDDGIGKARTSLAAKKRKVAILFNPELLDDKKVIFFNTFFNKLGISMIIVSSYRLEETKPVLLLMTAKKYLEDKAPEIRGATPLPQNTLSFSLFKLCECISLILNKQKRLRKAYNRAIAKAGVTEIDNNSLLVLLKE
jgi:radical SAM superfamily enzyme YgiQ (UPF0313 family)